MLNEYYNDNLRAVAITIPNDDSDSDGEYYSLNQYSAACLVRFKLLPGIACILRVGSDMRVLNK